MKTTGIIVALMLSSSVVFAEAPVQKAETEQDLKALLRRLVPEEAEEAEEAKDKVAALTAENKVAAKKGKADVAPVSIKTTPSSEKLAGNVIPFAFGLLIAFGFFTLANRRKQSGDRAIRRIAIEPLGSKQNLMLVEALGEYLLVATGGREPVLLAQLDTDQAKERLEKLNASKPSAPTTNISLFTTIKSGLQKLVPNRTPSFDDILDEAPINIESTAPKKTKSTSAAKLALAQASLRAIENDNAPKKKSLNERLAEIAAEESPSKKTDSREDRADAIRRRLATL